MASAGSRATWSASWDATGRLLWRVHRESVSYEGGVTLLSAWQWTCACELVEHAEPVEIHKYWEAPGNQLTDVL